MGKVFIYGLTGMSGAGKSTVCKVFADKGLNIIDCDKVSREVTKKDSKCLKKLSEVFSKDIITQSGELNRRLLGGIVFSNKEKLQLLNDTIYPYITYNILKKLENEKGIVILDAPTLFESGIDFICDGVISVICNREASLNRITLRDNIDIKWNISFAERYGLAAELYAGISVDSLPFSVRATKRFINNGITSVQSLLETSPQELMSWKGFGKTCLDEVESYCLQLCDAQSTVVAHSGEDHKKASTFLAYAKSIGVDCSFNSITLRFGVNVQILSTDKSNCKFLIKASGFFVFLLSSTICFIVSSLLSKFKASAEPPL